MKVKTSMLSQLNAIRAVKLITLIPDANALSHYRKCLLQLSDEHIVTRRVVLFDPKTDPGVIPVILRI